MQCFIIESLAFSLFSTHAFCWATVTNSVGCFTDKNLLSCHAALGIIFLSGLKLLLHMTSLEKRP